MAPIVGIRVAASALVPLLAFASVAVAPARLVLAESDGNQVGVDVKGHPVVNIETDPLSLTPTFDPTITDYVLRCQPGLNTIQITLTAKRGGNIYVDGRGGAAVTIQENLVENQAVVVAANRVQGPDQEGSLENAGNSDSVRTQYWIRCLPHDFPQLNVTRPGNPPPGWYLTSDLVPILGSAYAMVLDNRGTPVWYRKSANGSSFNVESLSRDRIVWMPSPLGGQDPQVQPAWEAYDLRTQTTRFISPITQPADLHELKVLPDGNLMTLSNPLRANVDLSALGLGSSATIIDCVLEELDHNGRLVWRWRASDHVSAVESTHPVQGEIGRQIVFDVYHCNSIDTDPVSGNVLISMRHADALFLISATTGLVIWKLGGTRMSHDRPLILTIADDPEGAFHAQHDARFQRNNDISLYDDQSWNPSLAARGVEYHVDTTSGIASLVWAYQSPDGLNSAATGSFRRLNGGSDNVIGWGVKANSLFTEVDDRGRLMLAITFANISYRVVKVPTSQLDLALLRATAGLPPYIVSRAPVVGFVGPASGPAGGGGIVNILGKGFTGASAVVFGTTPTSFVVHNDLSLTATVPAGSGTVHVVVKGPGGRSSLRSTNQLLSSSSDATFESGVGSWSAGANASVGLSSEHSRSGTYALRLSPVGAGYASAKAGQYSIPEGAEVAGRAWLLTPGGSDQVKALLTFYDAVGAAIEVIEGAVITSSAGTWTNTPVTATAPNGTFSTTLSVADLDPSGDLYVDDAALSGDPSYSYQESRIAV
jgi:hypothetical protein